MEKKYLVAMVIGICFKTNKQTNKRPNKQTNKQKTKDNFTIFAYEFCPKVDLAHRKK